MPTEAVSVRAIFDRAVEITSDAERTAFLDAACADAADLRGEVEALLAAHAEAGSFLESPAPGLTTSRFEKEEISLIGAQIGPYKLLQQIGEGGMGIVYMARQERPVQRMVALKIIKPGMDSAQVIARFEAERQALALMDHPNIARVIDAGTTDAGGPYFVMELVKGIPIIQYADEHRLTACQRLELFIPVCHAVQHAHQKGIIHRDLKPTNVLVADYDDRPVPKVINFGVAKAIGQHLTEKTMFTQFGQVVGTIEYMSPEQAKLNQADIDTRTDIYSLGVLLYELLTGEIPFDRQRLHSGAFDEMLRIIREEEPPKPSTRLSSSKSLPSISAQRQLEPKKLTMLIAGELDWIVMKALEKDRTRRYETPTAFARDIQRYLADEPVEACPPSVGYRLRKFARRNKGALAVAATMLLLLVLLGSGVGWILRDRSARDAAAAQELQERQARVTGQVDSIFREVDRLEEEQKWPEALEATRRADAAMAGGEAYPATAELVHKRLRELEFVDRVERIRIEGSAKGEGNGRIDAAIAEWKKVFEVGCKDFRAHNYLAVTMQDYGRVDDAIAEWNKVIELNPSFVDARNSIGLALLKKGRADEAIAVYRKAIELTPAIAKTYVNLADALRTKGQLDEAIATLQKSIGLQPELKEVYSVMSALAVDCAAQGRSADALRLIDDLLANADRPGGSPPTDWTTVVSCIRQFAKLGDVASCRVAAEALEKKNLSDSTWLYNAACGRAIIAAAQMHAGDLQAARASNDDANRAMIWLSMAISAGFADAILMRHDANLDPLRDREDFHKLLANIEAKATPVGLARSYILLSQWDRAAAEYAKADLLARPWEDDAFAYACLFLIRGDDEGYNRVCRDLIRRVEQMKAPYPYEAYLVRAPALYRTRARSIPLEPFSGRNMPAAACGSPGNTMSWGWRNIAPVNLTRLCKASRRQTTRPGNTRA